MKTLRCKSRIIFSLMVVAAFLALVSTGAFAGGPLLLGPNGRPVLWPRTVIQGGALNSQTVDEQGRIWRVGIEIENPINQCNGSRV